MNFDLSPDQLVLQRSVREFCARWIIPNAARWDREETFPHEVIAPLGEMGLLGMQFPQEYGGAGLSCVDSVVALEERREEGRIGLRRPGIEEANLRHRRLLRLHRKRPRSGRAADQRDELPPLQ